LLIAKRRSKNLSLPHVELPFLDVPVKVTIPPRFDAEIDEMALELYNRNVMTAPRAQTYIQNFVKSSSVIDNRDTVSEDDFRLLRLVLPLHFGVKIGSVDFQVRMMVFENSMNGQVTTGREIKDVLMVKGFSESTVQKVLSSLRDGGVVQFQKVSRSPGYDYQYWI